MTVNQDKNFYFKLHYWKAMDILGLLPPGQSQNVTVISYLSWHLQEQTLGPISTLEPSETKLYLLYLY